MSPLSSLNISNELLTCFGTEQYDTILFAATFNPENNFEEIESLRDYNQSSFITYNALNVIAKTDKNKKKAIIYIIFGGNPFWATFDYINKLSNVFKESIGEKGYYLVYQYWNHKIFYFQQTSEFLLTSDINEDCSKLIMFFNSEYILEYKGILHITSEEGCYSTDSFTIFYNGYNYTVLTDGGNIAKSFYKGTSEMENITIGNPNVNTEEVESEYSTTYNDNSPTTILTTYIQPDNLINEIFLIID